MKQEEELLKEAVKYSIIELSIVKILYKGC
jgi:hypothetical protein